MMFRACVVAATLSIVSADFYYPHFNETSGLRFNGVATTSSCDDGGPYRYEPAHGTNDLSDRGEIEFVTRENGAGIEEYNVVTVDEADRVNTSKFEAMFGSRESVGDSPDPEQCNVRLRLTPSRPYKAGSVMRTDRLSLLDGFETAFRFQITDHSRACTLVKDPSFGPISHRSCSVHGGDGLALVIHGDEAGSGALGDGGGGMGYAGLRQALVIELDSWYNPNPNSDKGVASATLVTDDALEDHVAVQASPPRAGGKVTERADTRLGHVMRVPLADGAHHSVRVVYWPFLRYDLLHAFTASTALLPFLRDGGESRAVGTLAVYVDSEGWLGSGYNDTDALIAMPINLGAVLRVPEGQAWMGITAATGRGWQKHDVTQWYYCSQPGCPGLRGRTEDLLRYYDSDRDGPLPDPLDELARNELLTAQQAGEIEKYGPAAVP